MTTENMVSRIFASERQAGEILSRGTNFFNHGIVARTLKMPLPIQPEQSLTEEELKEVKSCGEQLILYPAMDAKGGLITAERIITNLENKAPMGGKILNTFGQPDCCYQTNDEPFFTEETARTDKRGLGSWRLVGTTPVPGTCGENFLRQTIIAAKFFSDKIYGGNPPEHLRPILQEPANREQEIAKLMDGDEWQKAAELLANLPFNRQFRATFVETLIQVILNQMVNRVRFLEKECSWTNGRTRRGGLISFGSADSYGACVNYRGPGSSFVNLGFFLSYSAIVDR
ncbi:MAG: hypothetical protein WCT19_04445 [Candidatus Paceibacterota bacterium]